MINKLIDLLPVVSCTKATRLMSLAMERKLNWIESAELKLHLRVCELCQRFSKQIQGLRATLRTYHPKDEQRLPSDLKAHLKKTLHSH